ncbi:MAG TPA: hypothetical protein VF139_06525 [Candidatus Polarisedimenticolaceae bacterium]
MLARALLLLWTAALLGTSASAADPRGNANLFLGRKVLDSGDWQSVDRQDELGVLLSLGRADWPVFIAVDLLAATDEGDIDNDFRGPATLDARTYEAAFGVRKIWAPGSTHPYVGAGIVWVTAKVDLTSFGETFDANDSALGPWVGGGVFWRLGRRINLGIDARWSAAEVFLDYGRGLGADKLKAGGLHGGITLGAGW